MEIFVEDALVQNFLLLFFSLSVAKRLIREGRHFWAEVIACLVGSVLVLFFALQNLNNYLMFMCNCTIDLLIILLSFGKGNAKKLSMFFLVFISSKYLYIGIGNAISNLFEWKISGNVLVSLLFVVYLISRKIIAVFYKKKKLNNFYYNLKLNVLGKVFDITAYLDSGNLLQDDDSGLSVLVLDLDTFLKIFDGRITIVDVLQSRLDKKLCGKYITCQTTHGNGKMFVCEIDGIFSKESQMPCRQLHALVGLGNFGFEKKDCQGLLSPLAL